MPSKISKELFWENEYPKQELGWCVFVWFNGLGVLAGGTAGRILWCHQINLGYNPPRWIGPNWGGGGVHWASSYLTKCIKSRTWLVAHMGFLAGCHWWCPRHPSISFAHCLAITNLPLAELLGETYWTICKSSIFLQSHITCQSNVHGLFLPPRWNRLIQRSGSYY
jgi:hypothetical protein